MWVRQRNHWRRSQAVVTALQRAPYAFKDHLANLGTPTPPISHTHTHNITHQYHTHTRTISPTNITHTHTHTHNITHQYHTPTHPHSPTHHTSQSTAPLFFMHSNPLHNPFRSGAQATHRSPGADSTAADTRGHLLVQVHPHPHPHPEQQQKNRTTTEEQKNRTTDNILTIHPLTTIVALTTQYIYLNNSPPCQPS